MFSQVFVVNLPFKTDRLASFTKSYPSCLPSFQIWPAVHGDSIRHPNWWSSGAGAWGCYRSHLQILEHCYQYKIESYCVFEDDAIFKSDFESLFGAFMKELPEDWQQIYLGGQLLHEAQHPPKRVSDSVYIPYNVNRTHCFAVHQRGYELLYRHLFDKIHPGEHIDHHTGRLHESGLIKVYCPGKWLVGQDGGPSNISGNNNAATFWVDPEKLAIENRGKQPLPPVPAIFLEASLQVGRDLERNGWHRGKWQTNEGLDRGVIAAIGSDDVKSGLDGWYRAVIPEAVREGLACVALHHPQLTWECVKTLNCAKFHRVKAESVRDAQDQLNAILAELNAVEKEKPTRNLIYHIWPKHGNGVWQWNVKELLKRIDQFDGVRSIAIATDENSYTVDDVKAAFGDTRIDNWLAFTNNPNLGEVVAFQSLLNSVSSQEGITFYAHAKGVKYDNNANVRDWAAIMYEVCLDNPEYVNASLEQFPVTGTFKNNREYKGKMKHGWHYSGTFFWFRNDDLFNRDWQNIQQDYYGSEKYLGDLFEEKEAGDLFGGHVGWLYHVNEMDRVRGMLNQWRKLAKPITPKEVIPIYINARNLLTPLRKMVEYLIQIPNARPIIVDNDSTWQPMLDWYDNECPVEVIRTGINGGKFGWSKHMLDHASLGITKYVVTDSDLDLSGVPLDVLDILSTGLDLNPAVTKCGLSLDFERIPDDYPMKADVIAWECQFWRHRGGGFCLDAGIDTTFAMRRATDPIAFETHGHLRADRPYTAEHWPWHWTPELIEQSEEVRHYIATANSDGLHWTPRQSAIELVGA